MSLVDGVLGDVPPLLHAAKGKQKEASISIPTVTIFLPRGLRRAIERSPQANMIIGWCFKDGPADDKLIVVVAGLISRKRMVNLQLTPARDVDGHFPQICLIGACKRGTALQNQGESEKDDLLSDESKVWLEIYLPEEETHTRHRRTPPIITGIRVAIGLEDCQHCAVNVITYTIPRSERMKFLSLEPMVLPTAAGDRAKDPHLQHKLEALIRLDPLRYGDITTAYPKDRGPGQGFRKAVALLNSCSYLIDRLSDASIGKANGHAELGQSLPSRLLLWSAKALRSSCQSAKLIMRFSVKGVALSDVSAVARQLDLRLGQIIMWPSLGYQLRIQRRKDQEPVSTLAPRYIALYNGVWLVINDIIIGQAAGIWLCDNNQSIAHFLSQSLMPILVGKLITTLNWLDDWPAGLKLNTQLSHFFRDMFVGLTFAWRDFCLSVMLDNRANIANIVYAIGLASRLMGLTMLLSVMIDLIQLLTLHWTLFYRIQRTTFTFFCSSIISLFHLFRGKKRNPLRKNRIDQATYELDQLLLGTIFFTLLVFLWLTVAIYYLQFGLLRLALVGLIVVLQTALAFLNHLPLFALMLRIKEPDRLPGGVELRPIRAIPPSLNPLHCTYYELHNTPLGFQDIFRGYNGHLQPIRRLPRLLWSLVIGRKF